MLALAPEETSSPIYFSRTLELLDQRFHNGRSWWVPHFNKCVQLDLHPTELYDCWAERASCFEDPRHKKLLAELSRLRGACALQSKASPAFAGRNEERQRWADAQAYWDAVSPDARRAEEDFLLHDAPLLDEEVESGRSPWLDLAFLPSVLG